MEIKILTKVILKATQKYEKKFQKVEEKKRKQTIAIHFSFISVSSSSIQCTYILHISSKLSGSLVAKYDKNKMLFLFQNLYISKSIWQKALETNC